MTLLYPSSTEKAVKLMEKDNKLTFIVEFNSSKPEIKKAVEETFKVKVIKINTLIEKGKKKAYIKLASENPALDVATKLGIL